MTKKLFDFYIDERGEYQGLLAMLNGDFTSNAQYRAEGYGIPNDIAAQIRADAECPALATFLKQRYREYHAELRQSLRFHKKFWKQHGAEYKEKFEKILGHEMPTYTVRLALQASGFSNWHDPDITCYAFEYLRPYKTGHMILTLVWESMLSQTFIDIRKKHPESDIDDYNTWGISELTAVVGVYQTDISPQSGDWDIGYSELVPYQKKIRELYRNRKNFDDYLEKAVKYFKKNPLKGKK